MSKATSFSNDYGHDDGILSVFGRLGRNKELLQRTFVNGDRAVEFSVQFFMESYSKVSFSRPCFAENDYRITSVNLADYIVKEVVQQEYLNFMLTANRPFLALARSLVEYTRYGLVKNGRQHLFNWEA